MIKGQVISGEFGKIIARQKSGEKIEIGEILVAESENEKILLQAYDLVYGSQISQQNLELIAGMKLEDNTDFQFFDPSLRNYTLAFLKTLVRLSDKKALVNKSLPGFFSEIREIKKSDLDFLTKPKNPLLVGNLRSGSKTLDVPIYLDSEKAFSHHILVAGTTGRGKSYLISNILWNSLENDCCAMLVLDPHDEYYGRNKIGLKDHPKKEKIVYYTSKNAPVGTNSLKISLDVLKPHHFEGVLNFSDAQSQCLNLYYREFDKNWIEAAILERPLTAGKLFKDDTIAVVRRRLLQTLDLDFSNSQLFCNGIFQLNSGTATISDIVRHLEDGKIVIIDTSNFSGSVEILIGSLIANEIFKRYKYHKMNGSLDSKPVISIVLEEAPRVLGKEVLEAGPNIFSTIAREGRKFKIGLCAITQLPSLIPREILANMNTKIILGIEMKPERQAIIESASQDLSEDDRTIASLDIGEALITSNFIKFQTPITVPDFKLTVENSRIKPDNFENDFSELKS
ncbi:MAG TPA: ATP-binding protein [Candidatus Nanoarchaeia archaeon]|nr:ATP-binding protein [Candidatus Nanoarchaeia archaeon]